MIKLIAFDWNGTFLSDTAATLRAESLALKAVGLPPVTLKKFQETFQVPIVKYWENLGISEKFLKKHLWTIEDIFHLEYYKAAEKSRSRGGMKEVLKFLEKEKIISVIYSNHDIPNIEHHLKRLKLSHHVDEVLARKHGDNSQVFERSKDKKLFEYIKKHNIKPKEVISVGDTEEEIEVGQKYGYHTVAITGGFNSQKRLKKQKPDFLIHNMLELKNIIKKLNHD